MKKKIAFAVLIILAVLLVCLLCHCYACLMNIAEETRVSAGKGERWNYKYDYYEDGTAAITGYTGKDAGLIIPEYLDGYRVTEIESSAFFQCEFINSVIIPNSVTNIGDFAFFGCSSLTSVTIPDSVTDIGKWAFTDCNSLTTVVLPDGVTGIGDLAFYQCDSLKSVTIPAGVTVIGKDAFSDCADDLIIMVFSGSYAEQYCINNSINYVIKTVVVSGECDFCRYDHYSDDTTVITGYTGDAAELIIPEELDGYRVTGIGNEAFYNCTALTAVTIPDSVAAGANPFSCCSNLVRITVSEDHPSLRVTDGVLFDKESKTLISYPCGLMGDTYIVPRGTVRIGNDAFSGCEHLVSVTIPDSVTSIGDTAFYRCAALTAFTVPDSVTSVGINPFADCKNLTEITVSPDHPTLAVINGVLYDKTQKKLIAYPGGLETDACAIPQGIRSIGERAFSRCASLTSITIPDSVTSIGGYAFHECTSLAAVTIPAGVTELGERAFLGCTSLTSVVIPAGVTRIGDLTFSLCTRLTSVTIPSGVTAIGEGAFSFCRSLTSVTIPVGMTGIGNSAFLRCESLSEVTIPGSVTAIGEDVFTNCAADLLVTVGRDSFAKQYCADHGIEYTYPDSLDWLSE